MVIYEHYSFLAISLNSLVLFIWINFKSKFYFTEAVNLNKQLKKAKSIYIEPSYTGVVIKFPIVKQNFHDLVNSFKLDKPLHAKFVIEILEETLKQLKELKNINHISTSTKKQITVVGDLHGQLDDLLLIFYKNGFPSEDNPYLFNGDFVDRGPKSIEVSLIIFCGFVMSRSAVYVNRGNHEDHVMNVRYGFIKEICCKYAVSTTANN